MKENKKENQKRQWLSISMIVIAAVLITWAAIARGQSFFLILPLYVSLFVGMLQTKANRYAYLLGGLNSILYALVYVIFSLYASAAYAILVSCPVQLATFWRWSRRAYKTSTEFSRLRFKSWCLVLVTFAISAVALHFLSARSDSPYRFFDNYGTLVGIFTMILSLLSFREYSWFMLCGGILNLILYGTMLRDNPQQLTYLIYSVYSLICIVLQCISVHGLYREQQKIKERKTDENDLS